MGHVEQILAQTLQVIAANTSSNSSRRVVAVRWFNRLYYDLGGWQKNFLAILNDYPGFRADVTEEDYNAFRQRLNIFGDELYEFQRGLGGGQSEFCARLEFLSGRIASDFQWLREENQEAYFALEQAVGAARGFRGNFSKLSKDIYYQFRQTVSEILDSQETKNGAKENILRTPDKVRTEIEKYAADTRSALEGIRQVAQEIGIRLLSVEEYDDALKTEGSVNPNIVVLGETVTMTRDTYNVGQAAAVGPYAQAHNVSMSQLGNQFERLVNLDKLSDELSKLREAMKKEAISPDHDIAVSDVAKAERAAREKDAQKVVEYLKNAGKWALDVATKIGTAVATKALKQATGMK